MLKSRCAQPPCRNWLVTSVAVSCETYSPFPQAAVSSAGTTPHRVMNASSALSPPLAVSPSSHANATKQAMTTPTVTTGVLRVGLASRKGIMVRRGQGFLVGFGVASTGPDGPGDVLGLGAAPASATATR